MTNLQHLYAERDALSARIAEATSTYIPAAEWRAVQRKAEGLRHMRSDLVTLEGRIYNLERRLSIPETAA